MKGWDICAEEQFLWPVGNQQGLVDMDVCGSPSTTQPFCPNFCKNLFVCLFFLSWEGIRCNVVCLLHSWVNRVRGLLSEIVSLGLALSSIPSPVLSGSVGLQNLPLPGIHSCQDTLGLRQGTFTQGTFTLHSGLSRITLSEKSRNTGSKMT